MIFRYLLDPSSQQQTAPAIPTLPLFPACLADPFELSPNKSTGCFSSLLSDPDTEVCLHALRLLQSVLLEPEVLARSGAEVRDSLPLQRIIALSQSRHAELQALAKELLDDLKILDYEA